jgi:ATP-dependent DNA helicase RecG
MVKSNNRITRKEMAEKLSISLRSLQRIINEMDELHYVGSGNHGHWEIRHDQY